METKKKSTLSFGLRYGYGLGEFGLNFLLTYITYYLTFYLTNVAGLSMTLAAHGDHSHHGHQGIRHAHCRHADRFH